MSVTFETLDTFDANQWQVAPLPGPPCTTMLLTWQVSPHPVDGGMPEDVMPAFTRALCSIGMAAFEDNIGLVTTNDPQEVRKAFDSSKHSWSVNAQWIVVSQNAQNAEIASLLRALFQTWAVPVDWPDGILMVVRAAVDGDAAACHFQKPSVWDDFLHALTRT